MLYSSPVYDIDELARRNLHVHTARISHCAKPEMVLSDIIKTADACGLEMIAITDHYNFRDFDRAYLSVTAEYREEYAALAPRCKVLFGSEFSAIGPGEQLESYETNRALDYRLYSCNHFHIEPWRQPAERTARGYARFQYDIITALIRSGRPDCIAHPLIGGYVHCVEKGSDVTAALTDNELGELLTLGRDGHCAFEINTGAFLGDPAFSRRMWNIGREVGVTFHFGTDAHRLCSIDTKQYVEAVKKVIE